MTKNKKQKDKNMFVWKPVTILKVHLYLNVRMKSFPCRECVESLFIGSLNSRESVMKGFDSYRFEKQKGGKKEP